MKPTRKNSGQPPRFDLTDTPAAAVIKLAAGDQPAAEALIAMVKAVAAVDPRAEFGPFTPLFILQSIGLHGAAIGRFFNQICDADAATALAVLHALRLGLISRDDLARALKKPGERRLDIARVVTLVAGRVEGFRGS